MSSAAPLHTGNSLLAALPRCDQQGLAASGTQVDLRVAEVIGVPGKRIGHVYFPTTGFISLLTSEDRAGSEVGLIGSEGMFGVSLVLGVDIAPLRGLVQGSGKALRLSASGFCRELRGRPALRRVLDRYAYVLMAQLAQMTACSRRHGLHARLARLLLMTEDRAHADRFHLTHEFLATMLGVRREGVTEAAGRLQKLGVISYRRGNVHVLDRYGLESASCDCYRADLATYRRVFNSAQAVKIEQETKPVIQAGASSVA